MPASSMAATADPRAKPPAAASSLSHHMNPWALPDGSGGGARDRRLSHRCRADATREEQEPCADRLEDLRAKLVDAAAADRLIIRSLPPPPAAPLPPLLPTLPQQEEAPASRPWNLRDRKRRPSARAAAAAAAASSFDDREPSSAEKPLSYDDRAPFAVALTAEEVEEDVYALTGARPRRRPRKRPRLVQRQLDTLFPGLWLTEITADAYKVPDE